MEFHAGCLKKMACNWRENELYYSPYRNYTIVEKLMTAGASLMKSYLERLSLEELQELFVHISKDFNARLAACEITELHQLQKYLKVISIIIKNKQNKGFDDTSA